MDWTSIINALIAAAASMFGAYMAVNKKKKEDLIRETQREQKQADRLEAIEHKLDIHNGYAEKLNAISKDMAVMRKDIEYLRKGD